MKKMIIAAMAAAAATICRPAADTMADTKVRIYQGVPALHIPCRARLRVP